jgi:hypothetical protein
MSGIERNSIQQASGTTARQFIDGNTAEILACSDEWSSRTIDYHDFPGQRKPTFDISVF